MESWENPGLLRARMEAGHDRGSTTYFAGYGNIPLSYRPK